MIEELLQLLITEIDAELLKSVVVEYLESSDVKDANECYPVKRGHFEAMYFRSDLPFATYVLSHGGVHEGVIAFLDEVAELAFEYPPRNAGHGVVCLGDSLLLGDPLGPDLCKTGATELSKRR